MLSRISSEELTEWQLYAQIEPFGEERADLRAGIVASTVVNMTRAVNMKHPTFVSPQEFMPLIDKPELDEDALTDKIMAVMGGFPSGDAGETPSGTVDHGRSEHGSGDGPEDPHAVGIVTPPLS